MGLVLGGFVATSRHADGSPVCANATTLRQGLKSDYIPHHQPFQYYQSTANPDHKPVSDPALIGRNDQANHQYDLGDFGTALFAGRLPAVSFITAKGAFDDSDGWYDHAMDVVVNQSNVSEDALTGDGACGVTEAAGTPGRCGYGPRLPLLVISPYARHNYVDHTITDQASILRFIEDNWGLGRIGGGSLDVKSGTLDGFFDFNGSKAHALILDQATGQPLHDSD